MPSLDSAVFDLVALTNAWSPPGMVRELAPGRGADQFREELSQEIAPAEERLDAWARQAAAFKESLANILANAAPMPDEEARSVRDIVADVVRILDQRIAMEAEERPILDRQLNRFIARSRRISTEHGAAAHDAAARLHSLLDRRHNILVDLYYFFMVLHAEHDPEAHGGPSFDNAQDLIAHLRHLAG